MVRTSWYVGMLATLVLIAPAAGVGALPDLGDPKPVYTSTLPGPLDVTDPLYYDDFTWCEETPCGLHDSDPIRERFRNAQGGVSVANGAWSIQDGGVDDTPAITHVSGGGGFRLTVKPDVPFGGVGQTLEIAFLAKGGANTLGLDGGLRLQLNSNGLGNVDCHVVPNVPAQDGYWEFVPLNPLCKLVPVTSQVILTFTVEDGFLGQPSETVAIDQLYVGRF